MGKPRKKKFPPDSVCKPCWELKYCPYGTLVEQFPGAGTTQTPEEINAYFKEVVGRFMTGELKTEQDIYDNVERVTYFAPWKYEEVRGYDPEEINCKIFGHGCPVFFMQSCITETKETRRSGRHIPRDIMLKVVRRDNHVCQKCHQYVPDDQIEFDHTIPVSRGGPTTVENLKLYCRPCNRKKSDSLADMLTDWNTRSNDDT